MPSAEINATLQQFLASVAGIEQSRFSRVLLANPEQYATILHQQLGDPKRAVTMDAGDAETIRRIVALATDRAEPVSLTAVGTALLSASASRAVPDRLPRDWRDAHARITDYLAQAGPLPTVPTASNDEAATPFREPRQLSREAILRTVVDGGILATDDELARTFAAWRSAPPFFSLVEQVVVASLVDLIRTLSAMRQHIVQPAVTALATTAPIARPIDTA